MSDERKGTLYSARSVVLFGTALLLVSNSYAGISGTESQGITRTDSQGIDGTDSQGIDGTDSQGIDGTDSQGIDGTDSQGIDGTDSQGIDGTDSQGIDGTDSYGIDGTDSQGIDGTDSQGIDGTDSQGIDGTDSQGIDGTDSYGIDGTDSQGIDGTDSQGIDGTDSQGIDGTDLLVVGTVDFADNGFLSVLGQSVFGEEGEFEGISIGDTVAIYGHIDSEFGGIADSTVMPVPGGNGRSLLTGIVDSVNPSLGRAIVGGVSVDYTATLSNGAVPRVGQQLTLRGRVYGRRGLVADWSN